MNITQRTLREGGDHLTRFHQDPEEHLTGYHVFHGDVEPRYGLSLMRNTQSTFVRGADMKLPNPLATRRNTAGMLTTSQQDMQATSGAAGTRTKPSPYASITQRYSPEKFDVTGRKLTATGTPFDSGVTYMTTTGPYTSKTGLPPLMYKPWSTEYIEEYRTPQDKKETLSSMTMHYNTQDALQSTRFQLHGYPQSRELLESSLTKRRQTAPRYQSNVVAY